MTLPYGIRTCHFTDAIMQQFGQGNGPASTLILVQYQKRFYVYNMCENEKADLS